MNLKINVVIIQIWNNVIHFVTFVKTFQNNGSTCAYILLTLYLDVKNIIKQHNAFLVYWIYYFTAIQK